MVIDIHAHLAHRNMSSDVSWNKLIESLSKGSNISKEEMEQLTLTSYSLRNGEKCVEAMDEAGIDKRVVTGYDIELSIAGDARWTVEEMNKWIADQVAEYPDKLYGLCAIDPRRGDRAIRLLEKAVEEWGMIGAKFLPYAGFYPNDPAFDPFYEKCVELNVPLHSHTDLWAAGSGEAKYVDPIYLDSVAAKFPDLKIVLLHFGGLVWIKKCFNIMIARPNVYADLSATQMQASWWTSQFLDILNSILRSKLITDRIMFGTDWFFMEHVMDAKKWVEWFKNLQEKGKEYGFEFNQEDIEKILFLNAKKFLNL